ncbi:hypothetical protein C2857_006309 [Epichloe festucae Fl1]|uniref:JmjC domain-containing protein n=1 Tax=Epichloe festucae (strain Fl1) TaxID=877507 RepID=A0A7S9PSM6_EPIFF|nr:hypothetical protein C2857_006309 [Epichloe festucae Fl1]
MNRTSLPPTTWKRQLHTTHQRLASLLSIDTANPSPRGYPDIQAFQQKAFIPKKPFLFLKDADSPTTHLPALSTWFSRKTDTVPSTPFAPFVVNKFQEWPFPYELTNRVGNHEVISLFRDSLLASSELTDQVIAGILQSAVTQDTNQEFLEVYAPLRLLIKALEFNGAQNPVVRHPLQLYIAQSALPDLPQPMQDGLPAPELVRRAGKGDIYSSSIWMGTEPTYTPLHRDPNPNLFCQLCSRKVVRLLPPSTGDRLFFEVQVQIKQQGNSRIRTTDMMQGEERLVLHDAVWGNTSPEDNMYEAELEAGDALFIPEGWWHSVKSVGSDGELNGSVNWWFR